MSVTLSYPRVETVVETGPFPEDLVRRQIWRILAGLYPPGQNAERRIDQRFPYPHLLYLTPVAADGVSVVGDSVVVVGKHLSERGIGFYYQAQQPLPYRRMIASLETRDQQWDGFLIDITWCRFTSHGWYDSGGRFLQAAPSPVPRRPAKAG